MCHVMCCIIITDGCKLPLNIMKFFSLLILTRLAASAWLFTEHKICNPRNTNILPFTGFRINRIYKLLGLSSYNYLSIAHCDHGSIDYQKTILLPFSTAINFETPFCMLKPQLGKTSKLKDEFIINNSTFLGSRLISAAKKKMDEILEKNSRGSFIEYIGRNQYYQNDNMKKADPQTSLKTHAKKNLVCYKMARRPKYSKRNYLFYVPETFVGGLFECPVPSSLQAEIIQNLSGNDIIKPFEFSCDSSIAKPILPLIAEDSTSRWIDYDILNNPLNPSIIQTIPYLSSVTPFNIRFSSMESSDMYRDTWASRIDVNENYAYTEVDLNLISKALALSADYLNKIYSPPDVPKVVSRFNAGLTLLSKNFQKLLVLAFNNMNLQDKIEMFLSYQRPKFVRKHLEALQKIWDDTVGEI